MRYLIAGTMRCFSMLFLLLLAASSGVAEPTGHVPKTDFLPSRDMYPVPNKSRQMWFGKAAVGVSGSGAEFGACIGEIDSALVQWEHGKTLPATDPMSKPLAQVLSAAVANHPTKDKTFGFKVSHAIQKGAGDYIPDADRVAAGSAADITSKLDSTRKPVRITLKHGPTGVLHALAVYDYYEAGGKIHLKVADPNYPPGVTDSKADSRVLIFDKAKGKFDTYDTNYSSPEVITKPIAPAKRDFYLKTLRDAAIKYELPSPVPLSQTSTMRPVTVTNDPKVGGVLIQFDPAMLDGSVAEQDLEAVETQVQQFIDSGKQGGAMFKVGRQPEEPDWVLLSLNHLAKSDTRALNGLTRVCGYVNGVDGDLVIVGRREKRMLPMIGLDTLTVALRAIWRDDMKPFVSLDPHPRDFSGPQKVRVGGLPEDLKTTDFVRVMLEADYLMKQVDLGVMVPDLPGFKSLMQLSAENQDKLELTPHRAWLSPLSAPVADILEWNAGGYSAVVFQGGVQVMTEAMRVAGDGLVGTGRTDFINREASAQWTRNYAELVRLKGYEVLHELQGVLDVCKLCALWRARGVKHPALDKLAARTPATGLTKSSYEGIKPRHISGSDIGVTGGAQARTRVNPRSIIKYPQLEQLMGLCTGGWSIEGDKKSERFRCRRP